MSRITACAGKIWTKHLRYKWSYLRHFRAVKKIDSTPYADYIPTTAEGVKSLTGELHRRFDYTPDGADRLFDSIITPAAAWLEAFEDPPLKDDCDGFHSALYWAVSHNFDCRLLTAVTEDIRRSHTALAFMDKNNLLYLVNYRVVTPGQDCIEKIKDRFIASQYRDPEIKVVYWELSFWAGSIWCSKSFGQSL